MAKVDVMYSVVGGDCCGQHKAPSSAGEGVKAITESQLAFTRPCRGVEAITESQPALEHFCGGVKAITESQPAGEFN